MLSRERFKTFGRCGLLLLLAMIIGFYYFHIWHCLSDVECVYVTEFTLGMGLTPQQPFQPLLWMFLACTVIWLGLSLIPSRTSEGSARHSFIGNHIGLIAAYYALIHPIVTTEAMAALSIRDFLEYGVVGAIADVVILILAIAVALMPLLIVVIALLFKRARTCPGFWFQLSVSFLIAIAGMGSNIFFSLPIFAGISC